jgi:hypothetical protein
MGGVLKHRGSHAVQEVLPGMVSFLSQPVRPAVGAQGYVAPAHSIAGLKRVILDARVARAASAQCEPVCTRRAPIRLLPVSHS